MFFLSPTNSDSIKRINRPRQCLGDNSLSLSMEDDKSPLVREEQRSTVHNIPCQ